jgi:hypothetical protein
MPSYAAACRSSFRARWAARALAAAAVASGLAVPFAAGAESQRVAEIRYEMPGSIPQLTPRWGVQPREVVRVTDDRLSPRWLKIRQGESVAWVSHARGLTRITFEREVAASMICHSLVNFHLEDDELRSGLLRTGDVASFCELAPGRYRYRVVPHSPESDRQLSSRLEGVIEVEAARTAR